MIVKAVYYGGMPIARIYKNGKIVWQYQITLSLGYDIFLNVYLDGSVHVTSIGLSTGNYAPLVFNKNIESNYISSISTANGFTYSIAQAITIRDSTAIAIALAILYADNRHDIYVRDISNATIGQVMDGGHYMDIDVLMSNKSYGIVLPIRIGDHEYNVEVLVAHTASGVNTKAVFDSHYSDIEVLVTHLSTGLGARAVISGHSSDIEVTVTHLSTGLGAEAVFGGHSSDIEIEVTKISTGIGADAIISNHRSNVEITTTHYSSSIAAPSTDGSHSLKFRIATNQNASGVAANSIFGNRRALERTTMIANGTVLPLKTILFSKRDFTDIYCEESNIINVIPSTNRSHITDANAFSLSKTSIDISGLIQGDHIKRDLVESILNSTGIKIVSGDSVSKYLCYADTVARLSDGKGFLYPIQNGTDLYIPQIFGSTLEDTNLYLEPDYIRPVQTGTDLYIAQVFGVTKNEHELELE